MKYNNEPPADRQAERLDELLVEPHAAPPTLARRIVHALPSQSRWQRILDWLLPADRESRLWRPAAVALLPLALGFALGFGSGTQDEDPLYDDVLVLAFSDDYFATNGGYVDE